MNNKRVFVAGILLAASLSTQAELRAMDDAALSSVSGQGILDLLPPLPALAISRDFHLGLDIDGSLDKTLTTTNLDALVTVGTSPFVAIAWDSAFRQGAAIDIAKPNGTVLVGINIKLLP